ncbi:RagB/SusD family nutrient uptake outer membrane protein [Solitalea longa]|uniref:RagB/SusD family nutrient uptake outer membrane protein n=1 Tax=Solitalea longa TaxID=2079460 RepID=A0A2S5A169_9SPHI|nr:RagB/SusD family nutrient uptake outer membrane protein [Solitalea longa]POY36274.1 RagB/SusD family nutrient uptake outer membrane protein [Solitalea longa]
MKTKIIIAVIIFLVLGLVGCEKEWLDEKSDKSLVVPSSLEDFQKLLDYSSPVMNANFISLGETGADNYYLSDQTLQFALARNRNAYLWAKEIYEGQTEYDWNFAYQRVLYCNTVLDGLGKIAVDEKNTLLFENVKGSALFFRALTFYDVAQAFAPVYKQSSAATDPGIPLRLKADINEVSTRASVKETYEQIIADLKSAIDLLPLTQTYKTRPTKAAANGLLARVYLSMQDYSNAFTYADAALQLDQTLLDYNQLDFIGYNPFLPYNEEMVFYSELSYSDILYPDYFMVDSNLVKSYSANDLRFKAFFSQNTNGSYRYIGSYSPQYLFAGIANDELFLIHAECHARLGRVTESMNDLNTLMRKRFKSSSFVPFTSNSAEEALELVLQERRKELIFRGLRWTDLRRLNLDAAYANTLKRYYKGEFYELLPNSARYIYPIPEDVIAASGMKQNER